LIGHAREMALASKVSLRFIAKNIPIMEGSLESIRAGNIPGGLTANRDFAECLVHYEPGIPEEVKTLLYDPQTAGGLLISVASSDAANLLAALQAASVPAAEIGEVLPETRSTISIVP
jgi:selenide,water dikinase